MNAKEFIASKGKITDHNIRFLMAGEVQIVPLAELLDEYAAQLLPVQEAANAQPKKVTAKTKKK